MSSKCHGEKIAPQQKNAWIGFIKSLATFKGDLSSLTAPPFLLSSQSLVEYSSYWCEHPSLFVAPAHESDPAKRALLVLKWFLSTLKQQHSSKDENGKKKKLKPLNPFLGELFLGKWIDGAGRTNLVAEQVSHHPPATAFNLWNEEHGVRLRGYVAPKVFFSGTINIDRKGYSVLHLDAHNESYLITMPKVHVEGLMTGSLAPELSGSSYIRASSGYTIKIDYQSRGWVSGKKNSFTASVCHDGNPKLALYTVEGQWSEAWTVKDMHTGSVMEKFNVNAIWRTPLQVASVEDQHPLESRRAWRHVSSAIEKGDIFTIGHEKSKIENEQREMRRQERSSGREFTRRYFSRGNGDLVAEELVEGMCAMEQGTVRREMDCACGVWLWDDEKYRRSQWRLGGEGLKSPTRVRVDSGVGGIEEVLVKN